MTSILLTGGTGFFGCALLRHWAHEARNLPIEVDVLSRSPEAFLSRHPEFRNLPWLHFTKGDVLKPDTLPAGRSFTHIIHAATDSTLGPRLQPLDRYQQIVDGTRNVLDYAARVKAKRFLLTSSGGVYGQQPADMDKIREDYNGMPDPLSSNHAYGVAKRVAEHLCALYQDRYGLETVIARCFAFVGRDLPLDVHFAIGNFIRDSLWRDEIVVSGDGTPLRSYMDQTDLAAWLNALLEKGHAGRAYNVGSDEAISIRDLAHLVRDIVAPGKPVRILGTLGAQPNQNRYIPDITRAQQDLQLSINVPLDQAIFRTAEIARLSCHANS